MSQSHVQRTANVQFGMVDVDVIRDESLPQNVKSIYTYLTTFSGREREAFPSRGRIARATGMSVRTVDAANKIAAEVGLYTIQPRFDAAGDRTSNLYLLHDFGGGYVVGSGPREGGGATVAPRVAQDVRHGGADSAQYPNHPPKTSGVQTNTPPGGDDSSSRTPKQVLGPKLVLIRPKNFSTMGQKDAARRLTGTFVKAVKHVGLRPAYMAENSIGQWINTQVAKGITHDDLWRQFVGITERAVAGERCEWLIDDGCPF